MGSKIDLATRARRVAMALAPVALISAATAGSAYHPGLVPGRSLADLDLTGDWQGQNTHARIWIDQMPDGINVRDMGNSAAATFHFKPFDHGVYLWDEPGGTSMVVNVVGLNVVQYRYANGIKEMFVRMDPYTNAHR